MDDRLSTMGPSRPVAGGLSRVAPHKLSDGRVPEHAQRKMDRRGPAHSSVWRELGFEVADDATLCGRGDDNKGA
jgi:hypothetical protein